MNQIETRQLEFSDSASLYKFYIGLSPEVHALYRPFGEVTQDIIETHLAETDARLHISWGLWDEKRIIGHCFVMRVADSHPIFGIGLDTQYQGKGYGAGIASAILNHCDHLEINSITLTVVKHNLRAFNMYKKLGFVVHGDQTFRDENDSYFMIRVSKKTEDPGGATK